MKKTISILVLILTVAIISGYRISKKNVIAEKKANSSSQENSGIYNRIEAGVSNPKIESKESKTSESRPKILLMLKNESGQAKWAPSLWWNYQFANPDNPGC